MQVGLIGYPVGHSISPAFQQAAFDALGLKITYHLWETSANDLEARVALLRQPDYLGANVTIPHKQAIADYLDDIDSSATIIGAVNTIVNDRGRLRGFNTDIDGCARAIRDDGATEVAGRSVVVLGAGGSARAVVAAMVLNRAKSVTLCARRTEQATQLLGDLERRGLVFHGMRTSTLPLDPDLVDVEQTIRGSDILINTTPVGMAHHATEGQAPIPSAWLDSIPLVFDLVYNPSTTRLLAAARQSGGRALNGLPMLVYQGAAAFERWTGREAPVALMRRAAEEALNG